MTDRAAMPASYDADISREPSETRAPYRIPCEDCGTRTFELHRLDGCITFVCTGCGSFYIDDEGFGRP